MRWFFFDKARKNDLRHTVITKNSGFFNVQCGFRDLAKTVNFRPYFFPKFNINVVIFS
jgi:hypothetical protein